MSLLGWILPETPDVVGILRRHADAVARGMEAFEHWAGGGGEPEAERVRALEHEADACRRALGATLHDVLTTPIDREDLFVLGERLDSALNRAKNVVRLAQAAGWQPDADVEAIARHLSEAARCLEAAMEALTRDDDAVLRCADEAVRRVRAAEHAHRNAIAAAQGEGDVRRFVVRMELYRGCIDVGEGLEEAARRLAFSTLKGL